jgi:Flp pilus assembly protein TadG
MRNLLRCRRGAAAFATVIALVPLLGALALGGEAASWYVVKQHAQNAADAAAYSAGLGLACSIAGSSSCTDAHDYVYRGQQFASQNGFCSGAAGTSFPCATGISDTVAIDRGTWSGTAWTSSASGSHVRATVQQTQPTYLASLLLGASTVNIVGQAIAHVNDVKQICGLGLSPTGSALTLSGSVNLTGTGCALMSDSKVNLNSAPTVSNGSTWSVYGTSGCGPGNCPVLTIPYNYYSPPAANPLSGLNSATFSLANAPASGNCGSNCKILYPGAYTSLSITSSNAIYQFTPGVYTFSDNIKITGGTVSCPSCGCTANPTGSNGTVQVSGVNIVMTGTAKLTINTANVTLCAGTNNTGSNAALNGVLIDDQATGAVSVNGGGTVGLDGAVYAPKTDITWGGTTSFANRTCSEVIGNTLTLTGSAYLSVSNCVSGTVPYTQLVALVQ